ncbi:outer membrane protein assembly factor BamB precursor [mine drainage metagenome]|uniref:Outer membrane protein assembly factor BamB n=1 Tax=mine drainage metagenome TaxID=410659 RepID=A0A1J5SNC8_9ZZZZ
MKLNRQFAAMLVPVLLAACSSDKPAAEPAKLADFTARAKIEVRWDANVGDEGLSELFPAVTREAVFAANEKGKLYRFDRNTGKQAWSIDSGFVITGGVGAGEGLVMVGGGKGELAAFDEDTGKMQWKVKVSSEVLTAPMISDGIVVVRTGNQRITGLSAKDGSRLWLYERATPTLIVRSHASVVIRNELVYAGFAAGKLAAIGLKNGVVVWESSVSQPRGSTELERISDITSLPVVDDAQVCAVAFQGSMACFDAVQGGALWTREIASEKGLAISGKTLYVTDSDSNVLALDKGTGATIWKNSQLLLRKATAAYPLDDYLVLGDYEGYLHVLKSDDGSFVARRKTDGSAIRVAPVTLGDGALIQTSGGELYSIVIR